MKIKFTLLKIMVILLIIIVITLVIMNTRANGMLAELIDKVTYDEDCSDKIKLEVICNVVAESIEACDSSVLRRIITQTDDMAVEIGLITGKANCREQACIVKAVAGELGLDTSNIGLIYSHDNYSYSNSEQLNAEHCALIYNEAIYDLMLRYDGSVYVCNNEEMWLDCWRS